MYIKNQFLFLIKILYETFDIYLQLTKLLVQVVKHLSSKLLKFFLSFYNSFEKKAYSFRNYLYKQKEPLKNNISTKAAKIFRKATVVFEKFGRAIFSRLQKAVLLFLSTTLSFLNSFGFFIINLVKIKDSVRKIRTGFVLKSSFYFLVLFNLLFFGAFFYFQIIYTLPNIDNIKAPSRRLTTYIYDTSGEVIYKSYKDENRTLADINEIPKYLKEGVLAIEDDQFYNHWGVSPNGIVRAAYANYKKQDIVQGGSTITQQLIKNTLLTPEKTFERKIKEIILAVMIERQYSKDEIFEMYLNTVSFGSTSYGIQEASKMYFGKDASDLTLAESAMLAGLPAAPSEYTPYKSLESAKDRQKRVLALMVKNDFIAMKEAVDAFGEPLDIKYPVNNVKHPHFSYYVTDYVSSKYGNYQLDNGGLRIHTSLRPEIQEMAQKMVADEIAKIGHLNISNGSALITKNDTGEIIAMVGSKDFYADDIDGFVNITTSRRQPGSSIKPFNYSLALNSGMTAATVIDDSPVTYHTPGSEPYKPKNYDNKFRGPVTIRRALSNSLNVPAVKVLERNGIQNFLNYVQRFGINTWDRDYYGLSLALGAAEVKMTQMNEGYMVFANDGKRVNVNPILYIENSSGDILEYNPCVYSEEDFKGRNILYEQSSCENEVIEPANAFIIKTILSDFNARAESFGYNSVLNVPGTASKTGTTNDMRDNWTFGFNEEYTVGTWVGNNNNEPMSYVASGVTGASPIWANIISRITDEENRLDLNNPPENVVRESICSLTGQLACSACGGPSEYFIKGTQPTQHCSNEYIRSLRNEDNGEENGDEEEDD